MKKVISLRRHMPDRFPLHLSDAIGIDIHETYKVVLCAIVANSREGVCRISKPDLEEVTGLSDETIRRAIRELEYLGLLETEVGRGRGKLTSFRAKRPQTTLKKATQKIEENQRMKATTPLIEKSQTSRVGFSRKEQGPVELAREARIRVRRQQVMDAYRSLLGAMNDGEFITAPGLAKWLGSPTAQVRSDLMALFRSGKLTYVEFCRFRKSQRRPWHHGMTGHSMNFYEHGEER